MLQVRVRFFGPLHDVVAGQRAQVVLSETATVQDLLSTLVDKYGDDLAKRILTSDGKPQNYVQIFVNGRQIDRDRLHARLVAKGATEVEALFYVLLEAVGG